jgi:DoxX-like family
VFVAYVVVAVLLGLMLAFSAFGKLTQQERIVTTLTGLGVPLSWFPWLAIVLLAGAVGPIVGLRVPAIGVAAGIGP